MHVSNQVLRALKVVDSLSSLRSQISLATGRGRSSRLGHAASRFAHYGIAEGLDDELKRGFAQALLRIGSAHALALVWRLGEDGGEKA